MNIFLCLSIGKLFPIFNYDFLSSLFHNNFLTFSYLEILNHLNWKSDSVACKGRLKKKNLECGKSVTMTKANKKKKIKK